MPITGQIHPVYDAEGNPFFPQTVDRAVTVGDTTLAAKAHGWDGKADSTNLVAHVSDAVRHITAEERSRWEGKGAPYCLQATIQTSGWSGDSTTGYMQSIAVPGLVTNDDAPPTIDVILSADIAAAKIQLKAWLDCVTRIEAADGAITVFCYEKIPQVEIPVQISGVKV